MIDRLTSAFCRLFFTASVLLLVLAVVDWGLGFFGWRLKWLSYQPRRLLEFAAILMIFVIALLLRQVRQALRKP